MFAALQLNVDFYKVSNQSNPVWIRDRVIVSVGTLLLQSVFHPLEMS